MSAADVCLSILLIMANLSWRPAWRSLTSRGDECSVLHHRTTPGGKRVDIQISIPPRPPGRLFVVKSSMRPSRERAGSSSPADELSGAPRLTGGDQGSFTLWRV